MDKKANESADVQNRTYVDRKSDHEMVVTRTFDARAHTVFEAWAKPELFSQWWVPESFGMTLLACDMDVRVGGGYRLAFSHPASDQPMSFFGTYTEVIADTRIVWTNEESDDGPVTTVTFEEHGGKTVLVVHNRFPSKEALDAEIASGAMDGLGITLNQLEVFLRTFATA